MTGVWNLRVGKRDLPYPPLRSNGGADGAAYLQHLIDTDGDVLLPGGVYSLSSGVTISKPAHLHGRHSVSILRAASDFAPSTDLITLDPASGTEQRAWVVEDFNVDNAGTGVRDVIRLDLSTAAQFLSKLQIRGIVADEVAEYFVRLVNHASDPDGLFAGVISDCWSMNGYYLERVGDSFTLQRNTVTGAGTAFYVDQLATASVITIRDNNITSAGGALHCVASNKLLFESNQCEISGAGVSNAAVLIDDPDDTGSHFGVKIIDNNINTHGNATMRCILIDWTIGATIEQNNLRCYPGTGYHIEIGAGCRDIYVGNNNYFSSVDGTEIEARIIDNGVGTRGLWQNATLVTSWTLQDAVNGFPVGYFKSRDGVVLLRGNLSGAAPNAAMHLFTLPVGFRPKGKVLFPIVSTAGGAAALQIQPDGYVYLLTGSLTSINLDGLTFSTL